MNARFFLASIHRILYIAHPFKICGEAEPAGWGRCFWGCRDLNPNQLVSSCKDFPDPNHRRRIGSININIWSQLRCQVTPQPRNHLFAEPAIDTFMPIPIRSYGGIEKEHAPIRRHRRRGGSGHRILPGPRFCLHVKPIQPDCQRGGAGGPEQRGQQPEPGEPGWHRSLCRARSIRLLPQGQ